MICLKELLKKFPDFDPAWPQDVKLKWFEVFCKLLEALPSQSSKQKRGS